MAAGYRPLRRQGRCRRPGRGSWLATLHGSSDCESMCTVRRPSPRSGAATLTWLHPIIHESHPTNKPREHSDNSDPNKEQDEYPSRHVRPKPLRESDNEPDTGNGHCSLNNGQPGVGAPLSKKRSTHQQHEQRADVRENDGDRRPNRGSSSLEAKRHNREDQQREVRWCHLGGHLKQPEECLHSIGFIHSWHSPVLGSTRPRGTTPPRPDAFCP